MDEADKVLDIEWRLGLRWAPASRKVIFATAQELMERTHYTRSEALKVAEQVFRKRRSK